LELKTGIRFTKVSLVELDFILNKKFKPPKDRVPVEVSFNTKNSLSPDKKTLAVMLSVILFKKTKNGPFQMKVTVEGTFVSNNIEELKKFSRVNALAHLFPFVREIIGNTTMKANIPPLLLPPLNLTAILTKEKV